MHVIAVAFLAQIKAPKMKPKEKDKALKSYLVFASPKVEPEQAVQPEEHVTEKELQAEVPEPIVEPEPQTESLLNPPSEAVKPEVRTEQTQPIEQQPTESVTTTPTVETDTTEKEPSVINKASSNLSTSPYASARSYFDQLEQGKVGDLSKQGFSNLMAPKPLNMGKGPRTTQQIIDEQSQAFAGKGSGIELLGEFANKDKMVRVKGNCFRISDDPVTGGQAWVPSNACGSYDKFKGQLQKSIQERLNKHVIKD